MEMLQPMNLDLYDEYDTYSNYNLNPPNSLKENCLFADSVKSSYKWKNSINTAGSALQLFNDKENVMLKRPITAIHGVGYIPHASNNLFDPLNLVNQIKSHTTNIAKDESFENCIQNMEKQIMQLIDESCIAEHLGNYKQALEKAKEASSKEHSLIQLLEQNGLADSHNFELTYSVLFTVAHQYVTNKMYSEALNMYKAISRNKVFQNGIRLKINVGNIYSQMGMYHKALKIYRWVLDRIPNTNKEFRSKVLHNIGIVFIKMRKFEDACSNFEYVMQEIPTMNAGYYAVLCHYFLGNVSAVKKSFQAMLDIPLEVTELQTKLLSQDEVDAQIEFLRRDNLSQIIQRVHQEVDKNIITASNLISPLIEDTYAAGYSWCLEILKNSNQYASLSGDLEITKAIAYLRNHKSIEMAIETLKSFDKGESQMASLAYTNLAFIYYFLNNVELSQSQALQAQKLDMYSAVANVNLGNCLMAKQEFEKAKKLYNLALENDSSCVEAIYNLGLAHKKNGNLEEALSCFIKLQAIVSNHLDVLYQIADTYELLGDVDQATDWYSQLLSINFSDVGVLQKIGDIFDREGNKQQAFHYYSEAYRYFPSKLSVLDWLGEYFIELRLPEKAIIYFEKAALVHPEEAKWKLLLGSCYRQSGNYEKTLVIYKEVLKSFPNNTECLKLLIHMGRDLGLKETNDYVDQLANFERAQGVQNHSAGMCKKDNSSRCSSRSNSSNIESKSFHTEASKKELEYNDHLEPVVHNRPRTSGWRSNARPQEEEEFGDEDLDDELLPL